MIGDTNSGLPLIDEENPAFGPREVRFVEGIGELGWRDGFRDLHRQVRDYSGYSPNGRNGFRLDHVYVTPALVTDFAWRRDRIPLRSMGRSGTVRA